MIKKISLIILLIVCHILLLSILQFTSWPEMLSYPYLLLKGYKLYSDIINPYPPLLTWMLAFNYKFLGINLISLKIVTYSLIIFNDLLFYFIVKKIFSFKLAVLSLFIYILLQSSFEGNGLWFDLATVPIFLLTFYLLNINKNQIPVRLLLISGFLLSIGFLIKQTVIFLIISILFKLLLKNRKIFLNRLNYLLIGFSVSLIIVSFIIIFHGLFTDFLFWVFIYPFFHLTSSGFAIYPTLKQTAIIIFLLLTPFLVLIIFRKRYNFILYWFVPAFLFSIPRFSYFHLQPSLPFISLIVAISYFEFSKRFKPLVGVITLLPILLISGYFIIRLYNLEPRFYDSRTIEKGNILSKELVSQNSVFFYNTSSEYFVIGRLKPTRPWADTFPWYLEVEGLQDRIIDGLEKENTQFIVFRYFANEGKYTPGSYKPIKIDKYVGMNFTLYKKIDDLWILKRIEK